MDNNYTISAASKLSGVSELVIRAWESRYNAVEPVRTDTKRRLYTEADITKLTLLGKLTKNGHRIGAIASLSVEELTRMNFHAPVFSSKLIEENEYYINIINECINSIRHFNNLRFERLLFQSSVDLSHPDLIEKIVIPLMEKVGDFWHEGILKVSHEHFASAIIKKFLNNLSDGYKTDDSAPKIIVTTPQGQLHEVGALIGASYAAAEGWSVIYLGPSLPVEEIICVAKEIKARAIYLSIVYPPDDPKLVTELRKFNDIKEDFQLFFAGNSLNGYMNILKEIKAVIVEESNSFRKLLVDIRSENRSYDKKHL